MPTSRRLSLSILLVILAGACAPTADDFGPEGFPSVSSSPSARPEIVATLREDLATSRAPSDGGGRAWLEPNALPNPEPSGGSIPASTLGHWTLVYEAGPHGIEVGGMLFLQVSPFWGWSSPQIRNSDGPGYTTVSTSAAGLELAPQELPQGLLGIRIGARPMAPGERIRIDYGAGSLGALSDRYAESASSFWVAVDGDGDGIRGLVADPPRVAVGSGPAAQLVAILPSTARSGQTVRLTLALLDAVGNAGGATTTRIRLRARPEGVLDLPAEVQVEADDRGRTTIDVTARGSGSVSLRAVSDEGLEAVSNPLLVGADLPRLIWADLHGHSALSDGTGTPEDYFRYARDVAALDAVALTDHDHWGLEPLATHPGIWEEIRRQNDRFHEPGRFVTVLGYEWTNWIHGHRHVLYFDGKGEVLSSIDPDYETPTQLWEALRGRLALTFAHHSAGGPIATNWDYRPDPVLEPVTEVVSVHGSSEALDSPALIYSPQPGNFVRDVLDRGYPLGFIGSGDSHDGHPGLAHLASSSGGLAGIYSEDLTREGILEALRARRVYATNGPRIVLHTRLGGLPMGADIPPGAAQLEVRVEGTAPIARVDLIRGGRTLFSQPGDDTSTFRLERTIEDLEPGDYLYVRAIQQDGGAAWSSPYFVR